jgi:hypothetical protein
MGVMEEDDGCANKDGIWEWGGDGDLDELVVYATTCMDIQRCIANLGIR